MGHSKVAVATAMALALSLPVAALTGCQSAEQKAMETAAAVVNGETIAEQTITDYIQSYRTSNGLENNGDWAQWLVDQGLTPSGLRSQTIDYYVRQVVIEQEAKKHQIEVSDADINQQIDEVKSYYGYDDEQWNEQLSAIGYTPDSYRDYVAQSLYQEKLADVVYEPSDQSAVDKQVVEFANSYSTALDGSKKLKCIVFNPGENAKAKEALDKVKQGGDFDKIAEEYTETSDYDGWDSMVTVDEAVADAVSSLDKGATTDVVEGTSYLFIVKVEDVCKKPEGGYTSTDQIPAEFLEEFTANATQQEKYVHFQTFIDDLMNSASVEKRDMPSNLPYDVDLSGYTSKTSDEYIYDHTNFNELSEGQNTTGPEGSNAAANSNGAADANAGEASANANSTN